MFWMLIAAAQEPAPALNVPPPGFDLRRVERPPLRLVPERGCPSPGPDEIVVCAPAQEVQVDDRTYEPKPFQGVFGIYGAVQGRIYTEAVELAPGMISKRFMVGVKRSF